jgi:general stress protein 26
MEHQALHAFLYRHRYAIVSSVSEAGSPQSALVGIAVTNELEIVFDTLRSTRKYRNLIARPACAVVVGSGEQTVQFEGIACEPRGDEMLRFREVYFSAWPDGRERLDWPDLTHLVVKPKWIRYSDYDLNPPSICEMRF